MSKPALTLDKPIEVKSFDEEYKCGACNWASVTFYSIDGPITLSDDDEPGYERPTGLCSSCMTELLTEMSHR